MTRTGKITTSVIGVFLLLIVVLIIVIATFDWEPAQTDHQPESLYRTQPALCYTG